MTTTLCQNQVAHFVLELSLGCLANDFYFRESKEHTALRELRPAGGDDNARQFSDADWPHLGNKTAGQNS